MKGNQVNSEMTALSSGYVRYPPTALRCEDCGKVIGSVDGFPRDEAMAVVNSYFAHQRECKKEQIRLAIIRSLSRSIIQEARQ